MIPHFLLTPFNAGLYSRTDLRKRTGFSTPYAWMEHRLDIFEKYTVRSLAAQTFKDFVWLVVIDKDTPVIHLDRLCDLVSRVEPARAHLQNAQDDSVNLRNVSPEFLKTWFDLQPGVRVVSTRMDCDDAVHPEFMARVNEEAARSTRNEVIDFRVGALYSPDRRSAQVWRWSSAGPFLSVSAVPTGDVPLIPTCWYAQHLAMRHHFPIRFVMTREAMWVHVTHGHNLVNRMSASARPCGREIVRRTIPEVL